MKPQYRKLPESMRHKQLDLRNKPSQYKPHADSMIKESTPAKTVKTNKTPDPETKSKTNVVKAPVTTPSVVESQPPKSATKQVKRKRTKFVVMTLLAIALVLMSIYILILMFLPKIQKQSPKQVQNSIEEAVTSDKDKVFIPAAGIEAEIAEGEASVLDKGLVWHRFPERGDPSKGGNTILTGHSFVWGYTPKQIKEQSIFYNLNEVKKGDEVTVVWDKKVYQYAVADIKEVKPNATDIENKTTEPTLTIYTCTQGGAADGRVVVIAKPR